MVDAYLHASIRDSILEWVTRNILIVQESHIHRVFVLSSVLTFSLYSFSNDSYGSLESSSAAAGHFGHSK